MWFKHVQTCSNKHPPKINRAVTRCTPTDESTFTYIYIHFHTFTHVYIHCHTFTFIYIHLHTFTYIYIHLHTYLHPYMITYILTYLHWQVCFPEWTLESLHFRNVASVWCPHPYLNRFMHYNLGLVWFSPLCINLKTICNKCASGNITELSHRQQLGIPMTRSTMETTHTLSYIDTTKQYYSLLFSSSTTSVALLPSLSSCSSTSMFVSNHQFFAITCLSCNFEEFPSTGDPC
jgi:hypothetical protein